MRIPLASLFTLAASITQAANYDLVIQNGLVIDPETSFEEIRNLGIGSGITYMPGEAIRSVVDNN